MDTIRAGGCEHVKTPAMDRLLKNGVSFRESHCATPICTPSRGSIFTGRMPTETGVWLNGKKGGEICSSIPNMGQWFQQNSDYDTVYAGKWHVPECHTKDIAGFDVIATGTDHMGNPSDALVIRACDAWLRNRTDTNPFLMVASLIQPHDMCQWLHININKHELRYPEIADDLPELPANFEPGEHEPALLLQMRNQHMQPAWGDWDELQWRYYLWNYYRMVEMVDGEIGRLLESLDDCGLTDDTLIVFSSDHGEGLAHHRMVRKDFFYNEAVKVPLIFCNPNLIQSDVRDSSHLVSSIDLMPTFCDFAGIPSPTLTHARSLRPLLEGKDEPWRSYLASHSTYPAQMTENIEDATMMLRSQRYKYIRYFQTNAEMLFDMQEDPGEQKNLATDETYDDIVKDHRRMLKEWEHDLILAPRLENKTRIYDLIDIT
ncbi:MAG: sulfatase-like hydrolase/transferase [Lentisphaeria bacterium]|nr:sulfatase-like hydrolase/transferase [Lentisphaeria bacterium]